MLIDLYNTSTGVTAMPSSTTTSVINDVIPATKRCAYPSKMCVNPPAVKQNKTLHRLCEFHRRKANLNQQRMQQRRRLLRHYSGLQESREFRNGSKGLTMSSPAASDQIEYLVEFRAPPIESEFSPEELRVLEIMLFDSEDEDEESESELDPRRRRRRVRGLSLSQSHLARLSC